MSQSETWDRLRLASEWRSIGRDVEADREMPEPEAKWVRLSNRVRRPRILGSRWSRDWLASLKETWDRHDWIAWRGTEPQRWLFRGVDRSVAPQSLAGSLLGQPARGFLNPSTYERILRGTGWTSAWNDEGFSLLHASEARQVARMVGTPYSPSFLPRAGLVAALTALPAYRDA